MNPTYGFELQYECAACAWESAQPDSYEWQLHADDFRLVGFVFVWGSRRWTLWERETPRVRPVVS